MRSRRRRWCFNPRAPHGARPRRPAGMAAPQSFNPRAPHGARPSWSARSRPHTKFQSTRPARGATPAEDAHWPEAEGFNPRAPHGARLTASRCRRSEGRSFNPRAPHGARRIRASQIENSEMFQSTRPARGATALVYLAHRRHVWRAVAPSSRNKPFMQKCIRD